MVPESFGLVSPVISVANLTVYAQRSIKSPAQAIPQLESLLSPPSHVDALSGAECAGQKAVTRNLQ
jgi:hypothetical protein